MDIAEIVEHFSIKGSQVQHQPHGQGHIHASFKVETTESMYLLQRLNTHVFPNVEGVMQNISGVLQHLKKKNKITFDLIPVKSGKPFYRHHDHSCWRMFSFVRNSVVFDTVQNEQQAQAIGQGFGQFLMQVSDLDPGKLHDTLPDFHSMSNRLKQLDQAATTANIDRLDDCVEPLAAVVSMKTEMLRLDQLWSNMPVRVTHNDTKCNNVLLDQNGHPVCVIDLDTVMPGCVHYDYGDALRTVASNASEDETDLSRVKANTGFYEAFSNGYLGEVDELLNDAERNSLHKAPAFMAYIMGVRFLTDYLNNDRYYKTRYFEHNLDRAINQLHLTRQFLEMKRVN